MKNGEYWKKRMEAVEGISHEKGIEYARNVEEQFRKAQADLDKKINVWYNRLAENNNISLTEVKKLLRANELEEFHWTVEEYIEKGKTLKYTDQWAKALENASSRVHISRLEALKLQMQQECEVLYGNLTDGLDHMLKQVYTEGYYYTAYEVQTGFNVGWTLNELDSRKVERAVNVCWTNDGNTYSDRIWQNKVKLVKELNTTLTQSIIRGEDPQKAINQLSKCMNVSKNNAGRLIMTESAAISAMSQRDCFKELGVEEFEFVATLDSHTSDICRSMDGRHFKMSDYQIGVNAPPLHCWCRSCVAPYFNDEFTEGKRAAKDLKTGATYEVPADMTYNEWKEKYQSGGILSDTTDKWASEAKKELLMDEKALSVREKETAVVYSPDGKFLFQKRGSSEEVSFSVGEFFKLKGAVITHNHPSGGSFSGRDILLLKKSKAAELRVITKSGVYYMRPPQQWSKEIDTLEKINSVRDELKKEVAKKYQKLYLNGEINKAQRYQMASNEVNKIFAERYGIEYGKETFED